MIIQSLSVVVPNVKCINNCAFCVSRMRVDNYNDYYDEGQFHGVHLKDYLDRLNFARDNGCNTLMITGSSEPQQNKPFLKELGSMLKRMDNPFKWIEMQMTGILINDEYLDLLRSYVGVSTISISLSSFNNTTNAEYNGTPIKLGVDLKDLCSKIKKYGFNLRISINMTDSIESFAYNITDIFTYIKNVYHADQVTFRKLYTSGTGCDQDRWIKEHGASEKFITKVKTYIENGTKLEIMPFGSIKYSVHGMGVVLDSDSMSKEIQNGYKYLILRTDGHLYSQWDDKGSLIF